MSGYVIARVREAADGMGRPSSVDELARLSGIRSRGDNTDEEAKSTARTPGR
ncbi:hypothetical protein AB0D34_43290 [Streptomyces sp. NPDC048420]|uniref:hypothetical protein n=1 Tax=Streptomyces sp. NPDC048420 TaxID=3155755 RepID=UPI00342E8497